MCLSGAEQHVAFDCSSDVLSPAEIAAWIVTAGKLQCDMSGIILVFVMKSTL